MITNRTVMPNGARNMHADVYRIGWHEYRAAWWRGWRRPWQAEFPDWETQSVVGQASRALTANGADRGLWLRYLWYRPLWLPGHPRGLTIGPLRVEVIYSGRSWQWQSRFNWLWHSTEANGTPGWMVGCPWLRRSIMFCRAT